MLIYILVFLLVVILYWAYKYVGKDVASPAFLFVAPFVVACICASIYRHKWLLVMNIDTFVILLGGCFEMVSFCWIIHVTIGKRIKKRIEKQKKFPIEIINVAGSKIFLISLFQVLSLYVVSKSMKAEVAKYGISGSFITVMYWYREWHMFSSKYDVNISSLASNMRLVSIAVSYIWIYILVNNFICKKKGKYTGLMLGSLALGVLNCVILGARGEAIQLVVAVYAIYCFLQRKYNDWKPNIKLKQLVLTAIIAMSFLLGFKATGDMLGRSSVKNYNISAIDEVAKYLGAEIANLNIYLSNRKSWEKTFPGGQTFGNILGWIANKLNIDWTITNYLPFQKVNNISLGNVYTTFYAYICDFGFLGNIVLTAILAIIVQIIYEYMAVEKKKEVINYKIIINSYLIFLIAFSFFGERFFSYVLNISFIKYLIIWKALIWYITKIKFKINNIEI